MKFWLAPLALVISTSALANGFYVGGSAGVSTITTEESGSDLTIDYGRTGAIGKLYGGYRFNLPDYFVSVEGDLTFGDVKGRFKLDNLERTITRKDVYTLSVLGGVPLSNHTEIYGRLGYAKTTFDAKESLGALSASYSEKESGWVLGVGTQHKLNDHLSLRLDYRYTKYDKFKFVSDGYEYENTDQHYTVGVTYSF